MSAPQARPGRILAGPFSRYLLLRGGTAAATLLAGVCQTYTFARVLDPHLFSLFIVVGNLGLSLWLFDLGIAKVLYVSLRQRFLAGKLAGDPVAAQATGVVALYSGLVATGSLACLILMPLAASATPRAGAEFALFFCYSALNLVWFTLRNVSSAIDQFLYFETLEAARRFGHLGLMFCLLVAMPFPVFLVLSNLVWAVLLVLACHRLARRGALDADLSRAPRALTAFFRGHRRTLLASGGYAAGEMYVYNFPSVLVPAVHGLGAPTIIFDTAFKIFRGATVLFSAVCDVLVPRQTRAHAAGEVAALRRATGLALALAAVPALGLCGLLPLAGDQVYRLLLGPAATMPPAITPILVVLILANLVQTVSNFLLVHTGCFALIARAAGVVAALMTVVVVADALLAPGILGFATLYMLAYGVSALIYAGLALARPLRAMAPRVAEGPRP
ncbi:hypothetical protein [Nitrospirillum iridis]|uniref:O-antigen/teichoic acid export membrane protein n=1 Tax=Nitrospirillum iridis TaxID=765888 RepID=A0A7X0B0S3_9PROT|nr:hypothetical protein [Nitrospirillum iridis]MBB6253672.1 O-antigen/teichoic acid export membrane protein [Nitrospirillum iridis]